ncbi:MAG: hypothetical protein ACI90V_001559 [Bacillariaceae sp.]|jgi:hypothetical protein
MTIPTMIIIIDRFELAAPKFLHCFGRVKSILPFSYHHGDMHLSGVAAGVINMIVVIIRINTRYSIKHT